VAREHETLSEVEGRLRQREDALRQRDETFRRRLNEEVDAQVRQALREIDDVIAGLKAKAAAIASAPRLVSTGDTGGVRSDARAAVDDIARRMLAGEAVAGTQNSALGTEHPAPSTPHSAPPAVGERVIVGGLGLEAVVTAVHDGTADLDVRGKRMRASVRDLRVVGAAPTTARVRVNVQLAVGGRDSTGSGDGAQLMGDLNVIGCTVDEAISRAERFLDESLLTDRRVVRFIHGYGTGQLKRALTGFLQQHPLVARFATAPPEQGGGGVTVVELKD